MSERKDTFERLDDHRDRAHTLPFDIGNDRFAIMSDLHKWNRSNADFFERNEAIYCSILDYYREKDFKLVLNGDIEEISGSTPETVLEKYKETFAKEKKFVERGDCYRIYGNHDYDWRSSKKREKYLKPEYGINPLVVPALMLGEKIIIVHGHEGDLFSDIFKQFTKRILRLFKQAFTKLTGKKPRAAENHNIRKKREKYLLEWAQENRLMIIAGHTHRPVFETDSILFKLAQRSGELARKAETDSASAEELERTKAVMEELREEFQKDEEITKADEPTPPNYFNCGCGIFKESITTIEIDRGTICMIRWHMVGGELKRDWTYLKKDLAEILDRI